MEHQFFDGWSVQDRASFAVQLAVFAVVGIAIAVVQSQDNGAELTPTTVNAATLDMEEVETEDQEKGETTSILTKATESTTTTSTTTTFAQTTTTEKVTDETTTETETSITEEAIQTEEIALTVTEAQEFVPITENSQTFYEEPLTSEVMSFVPEYTEEITTTAEQTLSAELQTEIETAIESYETTIVNPGVAVTLEEIDALTDPSALVGNVYTVTKSEYILLCNLLGREYGANWISEEEKAKVIECVMNRVYSSEFPNTVREVLGQRNQFTGALALGDSAYTRRVTWSVRTAVINYLNGEYANHNYRFYYGDGRLNYFRVNY